MIKRTIASTVLLLIAGFATAADDVKVVRIASIGALQKGEVLVTSQSGRVQSEGWLAAELKKRGVKLEWYPVASALGGPGFNEALASKAIDFASYGDLPSIIAKSSGVDIKLIVPYGGATHNYLVVGASSAATSIKDLKGKRVSLQRGRPAELPFTRLIKSQGLTIADFKIYNLPPDAGKAALAAGNVDAYFGGPDAWSLEDKKVGRILWSTKQSPRDTYSWNSRVDLFTRSEFARNNPQLTELVATAYVKAAYWVSQDENFDQVVKIYARPGVPESSVRRDFAGQDTQWRQRWAPLFDRDLQQYFDESVQISLEKKLIRKSFAASELLDPRFAQAAIRNLQLQDYWTPRAIAVAATQPRTATR